MNPELIAEANKMIESVNKSVAPKRNVRNAMVYDDLIPKGEKQRFSSNVWTAEYIAYFLSDWHHPACFYHDKIVENLRYKGFHQLYEQIKNTPIDYDGLIDQCKIHKSKFKNFNVFIPVKDREHHMWTFLDVHHRLFEKFTDWGVTIILQENDDILFKKLVSYIKENNIDYLSVVYLPHSSLSDILQNNMNRSLCYNIASKIIECTWHINHDVDLVFTDNFILNAERKTRSENFKWLQPFRGSRVIYLNKEQSNTFVSAMKQGLNIEYTPPPLKNTPTEPGAPGGSILVNRESFKQMGGYDAELVWGYAPEDKLFWRKLEYFHMEDLGFIDTKISNDLKQGIRKSTPHPFIRDDVFSHDSDVDLFHLYHEPTKVESRFPYWNSFASYYFTNGMSSRQISNHLNVAREKYE